MKQYDFHNRSWVISILTIAKASRWGLLWALWKIIRHFKISVSFKLWGKLLCISLGETFSVSLKDDQGEEFASLTVESNEKEISCRPVFKD